MIYNSVKRLLDVVLASLAIVLTSPIWLACAAAIKLNSAGPVMYAGRRIGKGGKEFSMLKLRTMQLGADQAGPGVTATDDPRITGVGRMLRSTKLDELPQLLNVVRGDMSLVGPRPEAPKFVSEYTEVQRQVLAVRPGITGPAQLRFRHEERMLNHADAEDRYRRELLPRKLEIDIDYVNTRSLPQDMRLLLLTARVLVSRGRNERKEAVSRR
ncbi:MAG: sugar transferase [Chloroflexota bacterium]